MNVRLPKLNPDDGRIHLTFAQIAFFITILASIAGTWADLSTRLARIEERQLGMEAKYHALELRVSRVEDSIRR